MIAPDLLEAMASAAYEATRTPSFPSWVDVTEGYRSDMRKAISAAVKAGEATGQIAIKGRGE